MIDWTDNFRKFNVLGLWHATRYLMMISTVKDPSEVARDVVQEAWLTMWRRGQFTKGLFVTVVMGLASNAARDSRPIEIRRIGSKPRQSRVTDTFPVQVFASYIGEVTFEEDIESPNCGDE